MKKKYLFMLSTIIFLKTTVAFAVEEYVRLEPGAFADVNTSSGGGLAGFLGQVFNFGIAAAVTLSLVMIIWGGVKYMTTDSWNGKEEGKTRIWEALQGLGLALISYLIIYTINPCAVDFAGNKGCDKANTFLNTSAAPKITTPNYVPPLVPTDTAPKPTPLPTPTPTVKK